jgi:hypothetical protein
MRGLRGDTLRMKERALEQWIGKKRVYPYNNTIVREEITGIEPFQVSIRTWYRDEVADDTYDYETTYEMIETLELLEYK